MKIMQILETSIEEKMLYQENVRLNICISSHSTGENALENSRL
jgi:hypothetical protein